LHKSEKDVSFVIPKITLCIREIQPHLRIINLYQCTSGFDTGFRRLYDHYFLYVHSGKGVITIGDHAYVTIPGDLFFCPPSINNRIFADTEEPFLLSGINFDFTHNHQDNKLMIPIQADVFNPTYITETICFQDFDGLPEKISLENNAQIHQLILDMIHQYQAQKWHWQSYTNALFLTFLIAIIQQVTSRPSDASNHQRANEIINYITKNFKEDLTNRQLAELFHYNCDYISKIVYAYTGLPLKQYIISLRIREALNLLSNSDLKISEIALKVGYNNLHYFSRIFKMKTGFPPNYFRRH
jgi:AraC-like DNA-binding protein